MLLPDFFTFLASNTIIGVLALLGWILVVAAVVWLLEKAVEKFLGRTATRAKTPAPSSEATGAPTPEPAPATSPTCARTDRSVTG
jgi:hypothetical protein